MCGETWTSIKLGDPNPLVKCLWPWGADLDLAAPWGGHSDATDRRNPTQYPRFLVKPSARTLARAG